MPKLIVTLADGSQQTHELTEDVVTIGRVSDNTIQIDDASVSSLHAQLTLQGHDYALQDTGSTNGTRFNGKSVKAEEEHQLQDGDQLRFGSIDVTYASEVAAEARPMPVEEEPTLAAAATSSRPADFSNASPFQTKKKKKDPVATALMAFAVVAILAFGAAVASVFTLKSPF
jgi:pSer/pThr/pTyr-binding forkhead associated (FHA) protein